jgi:thiamine biosynthesis lipoprotein ApbE
MRFAMRREWLKSSEERIQNDTTVSFDLDEFKKLLGDDDTLANQREKIVSEANERQESIIALHDELQQAISKAADHAARQLSTSSEPLTLIVKLNEQKEIEQVYEPVA